MKTLLLPLIGTVGIWMNAGFAKKDPAKPEAEELTRPTLNINQEIYLSDTRGVMTWNVIPSLKVKDNVKFYLTDGTVLTGYIKEVINESNKIFKVYGELNNRENAGFGFGLSDDGAFGGAIVFRNTQETYVIKYLESIKGYIMIKAAPKTLQPASIKKEKKKLTNFIYLC
jgi:hypothetical protein